MKIFLLLMSIHFLADFVLQSDWMARNKSKANLPLAIHVFIYAFCFMWFGWQFAGVTFCCHFAQDWITSRINSRLWAANKVHWFFVGVGADQLLHTYQLAFTYHWLGRGL